MFFFQIITDDALFCCYFSQKSVCVSTFKFRCHGVIPTITHTIIITCLVITSVIMAIYIAGKCIFMLVEQHKVNALLTVLINICISETFTSAYLLSIIIANNQNVNIVYWQKGIICKLLHSCFIIALISNIILKATAPSVILLKITYPFKHQCRWLQFMWLYCGLIWLLVVTGCILHIVFMCFSFSNDVFCTYWCQGAEHMIYFKAAVSSL